ncbi:hypothetical protein ACWEDZ_35755, partial [Streptomyces sp. NPDC005047]
SLDYEPTGEQTSSLVKVDILLHGDKVDADGHAEAEVIGTGPVPTDLADRQLLVELVRGGEVVAREPLDAARDRHAAARAGLPLSATQLSRGEPVIPTEYAHEGSGN